MKFDFWILLAHVWQSAVTVEHTVHVQYASRQRHPRFPIVITRSGVWMLGVVALTGTLLCPAFSQCLGSANTQECLFAVLWPLHIFRYQPQQRTLHAAVRLLRWQRHPLNVHKLANLCTFVTTRLCSCEHGTALAVPKVHLKIKSLLSGKIGY